MPEFKQKIVVESHTSPMKETSSQLSRSSTEPLLGNQTGSTPVPSLNDSKKLQSEIQRHEMNITANHNRDDKIFPPKITNSRIEEQLVRDDITKELYIPLSSTIVPKRKKEMLYVPLDFENGLTIDALFDSRAYVTATAQSDLDRIKQQAPANVFKINDSPNFQIQVAIGQSEKPIATPSVKVDNGDNTFAQHFVVVKKNLTGPLIGLHFVRHNNVVIDNTHGLIHFPQLTMQAKKAAIEPRTKPQPVHIKDNTTVPPMTTKTIAAFVDHPSELHTTSTVTPVGKFTKAASLLISDSISTIIDKKIAVRITNTTESPYLVKNNTQTAEFSVATPEQSKFIKPVDTPILSMLPKADPDLTTHLSELLRKNKLEQQSNTF